MLEVAFDAAPLLGDRTGVGAFADGLLRALAARDDVGLRAYALSGRGAAGLAAVLPDGVPAITRPMPARPLLSLWRHSDHPTLESWTGRVDVVHGINFVVPPTRRAGAVVTVHDLTAVLFPQMCTPTTLRYPDLVARAIDRGAHVHVPTEAVAADVREHLSVDDDHLHAIAPGVPPVADVAPAQRPWPYVLVLGTVEPRKDHATLVRAFDLLAGEHPDLRLLVAGGPGWGYEAFEAVLADARHRGRIEVLGRVDDDERAALLRGAAVLAYPSVYEGFGLPPIEAMSVGVPVVATDIAAVREVSGDAAAYVPAGDPSALAAALSEVIADDALRAGLVEAGRSRAELFTWERSAQELLAVYAAAAA